MGRRMRWPLGGFLVASALAHAAIFGFPLDLTPGSTTSQPPVVVALVPGLSRAGRAVHRQTPQRVAPAPRRTVSRPVTEARRVVPKQEPKPAPKPAQKTLPPPAPPVQRPPPPAAEESSSVPTAAVARPAPDAAAPPGEARSTATAVEVDEPSREVGASPGTVSRAPLTADFGTANGPRVLQLEQPHYPERALRLRREGEVLLRLEIDSSGHLQSATVFQSAGYGFDESALDAVRRARFAPAIRNGRPVPCVALLPVSFTLAAPP